MPVEFNATGVNRLFVFFVLTVLLIMFLMSKNRHENFKPSGPSYGSLFLGPMSYYLRNTLRKEQGKGIHHCTITKYSVLGLILNQDRFIHQKRIANW